MPLRLTRKMIQPGSRRLGYRTRSLLPRATMQENTALPAHPACVRRAVIDALSASIALLDADGVIVMVNNAWCCFANANALRSADFGVGINYLQVCEMADEAIDLARGIRRVLSRITPLLSIEYPCHSPNVERWFELTAAPLEDVQLPGAVLSHVDITLRKLAERNMLAGAMRLADAQRIAKMGSWEFDLLTMYGMLSDEMCRLSYCHAFGEVLDCNDFLALAHPEDRDQLARAMIPTPDAPPQVSLEYRTHPAMGRVRLLSAIIQLVPDANGQLRSIRGTAQDISERQRADEALRASEQRFVTAFNEAPIGMALVARDGAYLKVNDALCALLGYPEAMLLTKTYEDVTHPDDLAIGRPLVQDMMAGHCDTFQLEKRYVCADGSIIPVLVNVAPVRDRDGQAPYQIAHIQDWTARSIKLQRDAERLQQLSRRLMATEEEERRRLGRELHDQIGSNLTAITLGLQVLRANLPPAVATEMMPRIDDLALLLRGTLLHIRDVLSNLRPPAMDEFGVLAALRYYVQGLAARSSLKLEIVGQEPSPRLSSEVEIALFRIAQEALTNVFKHAHAACVTISLESDSTGLRFLICDDGCGFDSNSDLSAISSLGMTTMQERAGAIGAQLRLRSAIGVGTQISIELAPSVTCHASTILKGGAS